MREWKTGRLGKKVGHIKCKVQKCQQKSHHRPIPFAALTPKQCATNYEWINEWMGKKVVVPVQLQQ